MIIQALKKVFTQLLYLLLALITSAAVFAFAVWFPNLGLLFTVWTDASVSLGGKLAFPISLLASISTNFTVLSAAYTVAIAILVGVNTALIVHMIQMRGVFGGGAMIGASGVFTGAIGLGCAACGSLILTSFLGTAGGISILALLPLRGSEFGMFGVALLGYSTYLLAKQITKPLVCESADITV